MFIGQVCRLVEDSAYTRRQGGQGILGYVKAMEVCKEYEVGEDRKVCRKGVGVARAVATTHAFTATTSPA